MLNIIKIPIIFLALATVVIMPKASYAWDQHSRNDAGAQHRHRYYVNDLTLVTGMDNIDRRVLIASNADQTPVVIDQPVTVVVVNPPAQIVNSVQGDSYIVNVPHTAGGYTAVPIKKWGNGYLGPQGELYYPFPEVAQLKAMYGL